MRRSLLLAALALAACTPVRPPTTPVASSASASSVSSVSEGGIAASSVRDSEQGGQYVTGVTDADLGNGLTKVLFFHAGWCPYCKAHDVALREWYGAEDISLTTYKIDYDSSLALRSRYGVLSQDTFVLVDGDGKKVQELSGYPSNDSIRALLLL